MKIHHISLALLLTCIVSIVTTPAFSDDAPTHKVAIHVDENDPARMNMALNNVANMNAFYTSIGETVEIELVAYGPGLHMLLAETSPVKDRISVMSLELDNLRFSACGNTHKGLSKKAGKDLALLEEAVMVPSGVVQLVKLQEEGFSYIRP